MVEVVDDRNRQMPVMYEMHAGQQITDELTAKGLSGHIGINKTVECIASRYYCVRYHVPKFPHSSATFNIISGFHILTSPKVLQGALGDSACPMQCSQPCPMPANRHLTGLTWFPIVLYYIK